MSSEPQHEHVIQRVRVERDGVWVDITHWCEECGAFRKWLFDAGLWSRWRRPGRRARRARAARDRQLGLFSAVS